MLGDMKFLDSLKEYDKDNIPSHIIKKIREKYITNKDFDPSIIKNVSSACEGLCKWIRAIDIYDSVIKVSSFIFYGRRSVNVTCYKNIRPFLMEFFNFHSTKFFMYALCIENTCCHFKKKRYHSMNITDDSDISLCLFCYDISAGLFYAYTMYIALRLDWGLDAVSWLITLAGCRKSGWVESYPIVEKSRTVENN